MVVGFFQFHHSFSRSAHFGMKTWIQGMEGDGFQLQAFQKLILSCPGGSVNFTGAEFYTTMIPAAVLSIRAKSVYLEEGFWDWVRDLIVNPLKSKVADTSP